MCAFFRGKKDKAILYFTKCLQKGLRQIDVWRQDTDLDNIRTLPQFKAALLVYYKQAELDKAIQNYLWFSNKSHLI